MNRRFFSHLWLERFQQWSRERFIEWRRIANGFLFLPVFLFMMALYYYPLFLKGLPESAPISPLLAFLFSLSTATGRIRYFVHPADLSFLPASEAELGGYFRRSFFLAWGLHALFLMLLYVVSLPLLIHHMSNKGFQLGAFLFLLLFLLKGWSLYLYSLEVRYQNRQRKDLSFVLRFFVAFLLLWGLMGGMPLLLWSGGVVLLFTTLYYSLSLRTKAIAWSALLQEEERLNLAYARRVGAFIDVGGIAPAFKNRRSVTRLVKRVFPLDSFPYFSFLLLQWTRGDGFGMFFRLFAVGLLFLFFFPSPWVAMGEMVTVTLLSLLQLDSFFQTIKRKAFLPIVPIDQKGLKEGMFWAGKFLLTLFVLITTIPAILFYPFQLLQLLGFEGIAYAVGWWRLTKRLEKNG
ncbi:membrane hypothetical protein [[Clostridium] ultunense Esp]|nr:membrane hypothetical protein [[Clostridium] ultunense Esp]